MKSDLVGKQLPYNADPVTKTPAYDAPYYRELHHKMHGDFTKDLMNYNVSNNKFSIFEYAGMLAGLEHTQAATTTLTLPTPNKVINLFIIFTVDNVSKKSYFETKEVPQAQGFYKPVKNYEGKYETILFYFLNIPAGTSNYSDKKVYRSPEIRVTNENYFEELVYDGTRFNATRPIQEFESVIIETAYGNIVFPITNTVEEYEDGLIFYTSSGETKYVNNLIVRFGIQGAKKKQVYIFRAYKSFYSFTGNFSTTINQVRVRIDPNQVIKKVYVTGKNLGYKG